MIINCCLDWTRIHGFINSAGLLDELRGRGRFRCDGVRPRPLDCDRRAGLGDAGLGVVAQVGCSCLQSAAHVGRAFVGERVGGEPASFNVVFHQQPVALSPGQMGGNASARHFLVFNFKASVPSQVLEEALQRQCFALTQGVQDGEHGGGFQIASLFVVRVQALGYFVHGRVLSQFVCVLWF